MTERSRTDQQNTHTIWTPKKCIALAKLMEQKPCLWSTQSADTYEEMLNERRDAWISIAQALHVPSIQEVRRKIHSIKHRFRKIRTKTLNNDAFKPRWYLLKHLKFLNNITETRNTAIEAEIWTPKKCIALAKLLEQKPCLWSTSQMTGSSHEKLNERRDAWVSIAQALHVPSTRVVHRKIRKIKEQFQQIRTKTLNDDTFKPRWYLLEHLKFLNNTTKTGNTLIEAEKIQAPFKVHDPAQNDTQKGHLLIDGNDSSSLMEDMAIEAGQQDEIWTTKKCIALAKLLEQKPCLWSTSQMAGSSHEKLNERRDAWVSIAQALHVPSIQEVRRKITNIKTQFQQIRTKSLNNDAFNPRWYLLKHLKFLNNTTKAGNTVIEAEEIQSPFEVYDAAQNDTQKSHLSIDGNDSSCTLIEDMVIEAGQQDEIWTPKKCIALAKLWKQKQCLWSPNEDKRIKALIARRDAVISIAHALNVSHVQARTKIESLRTYFQQKCRKKLHNESYESKWYLFKHLQFLNSKKKIKTNMDLKLSTQNKKIQPPSDVHAPAQNESRQDYLLNDEIDTVTLMENMMSEAANTAFTDTYYSQTETNSTQGALSQELLTLFNEQDLIQDYIQQNHSLKDEIDFVTSTTNNKRIEAEEVDPSSKVHNAARNDDNQDRSLNDRIVSKKDDETRSCQTCKKRKVEYATLLSVVENWEEKLSNSSTSAAKQPQEDQWDLFGAQIAEKMRNVGNAASQIQAKRKINQILFKYQAKKQENFLFGVADANERFTS